MGQAGQTGRQRWTKAFIAAPAAAKIEAITAAVQERGLEPTTAYGAAPAGGSIFQNVKAAIDRSDLLIAVVESTPNMNVAFELGYAQGRGIPTLAIVSREAGPLPSDLTGLLYVRTSPSDVEAIGFALDQLLASAGKTSRPRVVAAKEQPIGRLADELLERLTDAATLPEVELIQLLVQAFEAAGVSAVVQSALEGEGRADLAVWSDDLEPTLPNPLIIEVKRSLPSPDSIMHAGEQLRRYMVQASTEWSLLLALEADPLALEESRSPGVLAMTVRQLLESLRTRTFAAALRELRNRTTHR